MQQDITLRYLQRALDVTLACKLTLTYGKYHLIMLHRQLAMSEERTSFQQAERTADMMNLDFAFFCGKETQNREIFANSEFRI